MKRLPLISAVLLGVAFMLTSLLFLILLWILGADKPFTKFINFLDNLIFNKKENFREMSENLWKLLDDIDTASDIFKPNDEKSAMAFYKYAMKKQEERHKYLMSDGYKLYTKEEYDELFQNLIKEKINGNI